MSKVRVFTTVTLSPAEPLTAGLLGIHGPGERVSPAAVGGIWGLLMLGFLRATARRA